jgi:TPR repeat protein
MKAAEWYRKAAERGIVTAQVDLAYLYKLGKGVQRDYFEAAKWFRRAAEQGDPIAQNTIGYMQCQGEGVSRDYRQAADWIQRAAEQNYALAQLNLGVLYENGWGVPLNYTEAYKWYTLAANSGSVASRRAREALAQVMTTTQLRSAQTRVSDWMYHHNNLETAAKKAEAIRLDRHGIAAQP